MWPPGEITCEELRQKIETGDAFVLVDALPSIAYAGAHLPGAVSIPPERLDTLAARRIPTFDTEVVVDCANPACTSSVEVTRRLVELGYTNVRHSRAARTNGEAAGLRSRVDVSDSVPERRRRRPSSGRLLPSGIVGLLSSGCVGSAEHGGTL